jgi:hypothetical protein
MPKVMKSWLQFPKNPFLFAEATSAMYTYSEKKRKKKAAGISVLG